MKHRFSLLLLGLTAVSLATDTFTLTGIDLFTYLDGQQTNYPSGTPAGNGWSKEITDGWGIVALVNNMNRKYNQPGTQSKVQYGDGLLKFEIATTTTPVGQFDLTVVRQRAVTATATVELQGATAYGLGVLTRMKERIETIPAAYQSTPGEVDRSIVEGQSRSFFRFENASAWTFENGAYRRNFEIFFHRIYGKSLASAPTGSSGNAVASSANSGGRMKYKPLSLKFTGGRWFGISGTYNGAGAGQAVDVEVYNLNNVLFDKATCVSADSNVFSCDFGQMAVPAVNMPQTFKVKFRRYGALTKAINLTVHPTSGLTGVYVDFKYGDVDGDNEVEAYEVALILNHLGKSYPNQDFLEEIPGYPDLRVEHLDMDGDGTITMSDYSISIGNVGLVGD